MAVVMNSCGCVRVVVAEVIAVAGTSIFADAAVSAHRPPTIYFICRCEQTKNE